MRLTLILTRQQNALPAWYTHSTISGEATAFGVKNDALLSPPPRQNPLPAPGPVIAPPSLSSLGGLDALVTMDDDDDFNDDEDEDEDVKPSLIPDVKPKLADATPEARADCQSLQLRCLDFFVLLLTLINGCRLRKVLRQSGSSTVRSIIYSRSLGPKCWFTKSSFLCGVITVRIC